MLNSGTISPDYQAMQAEMHRIKPQYGTQGREWFGKIAELCLLIQARSVLDFGCGKGLLANRLEDFGAFDVRRYDPGIPEWAAAPVPADLVVCTDVMEHIEPDYLDATLDELQRLSRIAVFMNICTVPAKKHLPDGRNAHLIVEPLDWWRPKLDARWLTHTCNVFANHFVYVGTPR